jgi:hypothetical protein
MSAQIPAWIPCDCCGEWFCTIHRKHTGDCDCPPIDEWTCDPYSTCEGAHPSCHSSEPLPPWRGTSTPRQACRVVGLLCSCRFALRELYVLRINKVALDSGLIAERHHLEVAARLTASNNRVFKPTPSCQPATNQTAIGVDFVNNAPCASVRSGGRCEDCFVVCHVLSKPYRLGYCNRNRTEKCDLLQGQQTQLLITRTDALVRAALSA